MEPTYQPTYLLSKFIHTQRQVGGFVFMFPDIEKMLLYILGTLVGFHTASKEC